uniref:Ground-like domain-containing protein n=1 Tax=Globodera rostochiensis TaxID=31243 RepID=A0A914I5M8_GLORO
MNDVMLWLSFLFINFNGFSAMLMSNDLALANSTKTLSASLSTSSPTLSPFSLLSLSSSKKVLKKKVRISPILKNKMKSTTTTTTQSTNTTSSTEQFPLICDPIRPRRNAIEAAGGGASRPRNNYLQQLVPKEIIRKRRLAPSAHRQKRTGFPPPLVPPSPASSAFQRPVFPAPASVPDYSNAASQFEQPEPLTAEQAFRQGAELPEASESFQPPPAAQPPAPFVEPSAPMFQSSMGTGPVGLAPAVEPSASFFQQPVFPMSEPQVPVPPSSVPENEQLPAAVPMSKPQVPVPPSSVPDQSGYKEVRRRCLVEPYELLRYPLPECYTDDSNLMCCNPELENTMKMAFNELVSAEDDFQRCNVQQIANKVQALSEDRFNTSFEVISGIGDFASRSHFFHNLICKIKQSDRFILAYATARPEFNSLCIDGDTAGLTHAGGGGHASGDFRNSESVQQGEYRSRPATEKSDLLNFVYTFRRH